MTDLKRTVYHLLDPHDEGGPADRVVDTSMIVLILANGVIAIVETVPGVDDAYRVPLFWFEAISVAVFSVEYVLRLWCCTVTGCTPVWGRLRYALRPMLLVDLVAILPFFLYFLGMDLRMARLLRMTRFFRIAKLGRYSSALRLLAAAVAARKEELLITLLLGLFALVFSATLIYYAESERQPEIFTSIPASFWWAVTTLTTVGYGDAYPVTLLGKMVGGLVQVIGIALFALPTGLLASAFLDQIQTRRAAKETAPSPAVCPHCGKDLEG